MSAKDSYLYIKEATEGFYKEKGSKFFGHAIPCSNEEDAKEIINEFRKRNPNACHVCFAWRFGTDKTKYLERFSDDGEPSNSAGKPIFGQIQSFDVTNILLAVVRVYGGTNLGVGGLMTAYKTAVKEALEKANIFKDYVCDFYRVSFAYDITGAAMEILRKGNGQITEQGYEGPLATVTFKIRQTESKALESEFESLPGFNIKYLKTE